MGFYSWLGIIAALPIVALFGVAGVNWILSMLVGLTFLNVGLYYAVWRHLARNRVLVVIVVNLLFLSWSALLARYRFF
jgi:hypothetical protein